MEVINLQALLIIVFVSIGTYSLRVSGLLLSNKLVNEGKAKIFLDYLPATLLLSLIVPSIIKEGVVGLVATAFIALIIFKTKSILLSMIIGIGIVAVSRNIL